MIDELNPTWFTYRVDVRLRFSWPEAVTVVYQKIQLIFSLLTRYLSNQLCYG